MELSEQELRKLEKSTAEAHGSFSLGLFATALLACSVSDGLWWVPLVILGASFAISSIYLAFVHKWKRNGFLKIASGVRIKHVAWFLGFVALGIGFIQKGWVIPGVICIYIAYAILIWGIVVDIERVVKEARSQKKKKTENWK